MDSVFIKVLNISLAASWLILALIVLRLVFRKMPKRVTCALWGLVGIRLLLPVSIKSMFSLIPSVKTIPDDFVTTREPVINSGIMSLDYTVNPTVTEVFRPTLADLVNPAYVYAVIAAGVWIAGMIGMAIYAAVSYRKLKKRVATAVPVQEEIKQCEFIETPFILGVRKPAVYVPFQLQSEDSEFVLAHERMHLQRKDHWWKPLGFALLVVYWFNPLVWSAYLLFCRDIEEACDEQVIREMEEEERKAYSNALLRCSVSRRSIAACPLAFGETSVKKRVKGIMKYRKATKAVRIAAILLCAVFVVGFMTDPGKITRPYKYPAQPGTDEWLMIGSTEKRRKVSEVPEYIVDRMTVDALTETVLTYPFYGDIYAFDSWAYQLKQKTEHYYPMMKLMEFGDEKVSASLKKFISKHKCDSHYRLWDDCGTEHCMHVKYAEDMLDFIPHRHREFSSQPFFIQATQQKEVIEMLPSLESVISSGAEVGSSMRFFSDTHIEHLRVKYGDPDKDENREAVWISDGKKLIVTYDRVGFILTERVEE